MAMVVDPVCLMKVEESQAPAQTQYQGQTYYFCSLDCKRTFESDPKLFVGKK